MRARRLTVTAIVVATALHGAPTADAQVRCGVVDPDTGQVARAVLTLDSNSTTTVTYKRDMGRKRLHLIFTARGCALDSSLPDPAAEVLPKQGADEIPATSISVQNTRLDASELAVGFHVDSETFEPGSYEGLVEVRAPYLATSRTPLAVSRSESNFWIPVGIGALAGLLAFAWFSAIKAATREKLQIGWRWMIVVALGACGFGAFSVLSAYWSQDVWTIDDNLLSAIVAATTGATTGTMATVLAAIWRAPATPQRPTSTAAAADASVAGTTS